MNNTSHPDANQRISHILSMLYRYRFVWIAPAVAGMILSLAYVLLLRQETWSAKQSLIVRDDLLGQSFKPGRFESLESMKSAQETILEIARKPQVIRKALEQLGPTSTGLFGMGAKNWPSEEVIEDVQGAISFSAPNGAEFGKTEVMVLNTKGSSRERSRKFIELLLSEIIIKVDEVRTLRLQSMETELTQKRDAATELLNLSRAKLQQMDKELGTDVGAMVLNDSQSTDSTIKRDISTIQAEKRGLESKLESLNTLLAQLMAAKENPKEIVSISGELIKYQPSLDHLKRELINLQHDLAVLKGPLQPEHPKVLSAKETIGAMQQQLFLELEGAINGLKSIVMDAENQLTRLELELGSLDSRLLNLGSKRAGMLTLVAELKECTENANSAQSDLAEIQGLASARNADLLTPVDEAQVSTRPDGLGKKSMVLAGGMGGMMLGLGVVMLIAPPIGTEENEPSSHRNEDRGDKLFDFDSKAFEKIVTRAAAAAATASAAAVQSASKFFAKQDQVQNPPPLRSGTPMPPLEPTTSINPITGEKAQVPDLNTSSPWQPGERSNQDNQPPGTPSVSDLLAAASAISSPAPIASAPLSTPKPTIKAEPPKAEMQRAEMPKAEPPKVEIPKVEMPKVNTAGPVMAEVKPPAPRRKVEVQQRELPRKKQQTVTRKEELTVSNVQPVSIPQPSAKDIAAIQLAALRGTQDLTEEQPKQAPPTAGRVKAKVKPSAPQIQIVQASDREPNAREDSRTIVVSNVAEQAPASLKEVSEDAGANSDTPYDYNRSADVKRRGPNARPVDLAKSVESDDSTFVRINIDGQERVADANLSGNSKQQANQPNPFLKDRQLKESAGSGDRLAVPDQIRKLSDSIANFAKPIPRGEDREG